jgi:hypothetical protein
MSFRAVCSTQAASSLVSGAVLLVLPSPLLGLFGLPHDAGTQIVARILGGVLFALGASLLGARELTGREARVRVMLGNAVCDGCVALLLGSAWLAGQLPTTGAALALLFAGNCVSWLVALRSTSTPPGGLRPSSN